MIKDFSQLCWSDPLFRALGTQGDHTAARRAAITLQQQGFAIAIEITLDIAVPPHLPVAATWATFGAGARGSGAPAHEFA